MRLLQELLLELDTSSLDNEIRTLTASHDTDDMNLRSVLIQKKNLMQREDNIRRNMQRKRSKPSIVTNNIPAQPTPAQGSIPGTPTS